MVSTLYRGHCQTNETVQHKRLALQKLGFWPRTSFLVVREHGQEGDPRSDVGAVLLGHHARDLRNMSQIVDHPGSQKLPQTSQRRGLGARRAGRAARR